MYKARIFAKGFRQEYRVDFDEEFSPVVKMTTVRFFLGVVVAENLELHQLDVKTTFLHGDLDEEIYMEQLQGFASSLSITEEPLRTKIGSTAMVPEIQRLRADDRIP